MKLNLGLTKGLTRHLGWFFLWLTVSFLSIEYFLYRLVGSLSEDIPRLYGSYALRSLFFLFSSAFFVAIFHINAVKQTNRQKESFIEKSFENRQLIRPQRVLLAGTIVANFLILALLRYNPALFSKLALEGVFVEPLSALFLLAGSAVFCWLIFKFRRRPFHNKRWIIAGLVCLALIFFVIAMEEISWFQRAIGFETPESFESNLQGEFNIHNFATKMFENAYYIGAFICLIALPFLSLTSGVFRKIRGLEVFIGSRVTLCVSAVLTAYNYHYWNAFSTQFPFFLTLFILISLVLLSHKKGIKQSCAAFALVLIITQVAFIAWGHTMPRLWDATEYKEFFIAFGFFLYALDIKHNLREHTSRQVIG